MAHCGIPPLAKRVCLPPFDRVFAFTRKDSGFDPAAFFEMNSVEWSAGDPETAVARLGEGDAVLVADRFLAARDIHVGDRLTLGGGGGSRATGGPCTPCGRPRSHT